ncbi:MAG: hypothetical protein AAF944_03140 [Bacteroidota bacterium]
MLILVQVSNLQAQDCNGTCFDLFNQQGSVAPGTSCQPDFKPQTIGGSTCLDDEKCIIFDNTFQVNPPETLYIFAWGDGVIDTLSHQDLLNLPEEEDFIGRFRRYCHNYTQVTCPDPTATFTVEIDLLNPNGGCTNSAASGEIRVLAPVDVQFEVPDFICTNTPFNITNTSIEGYNIDCTTDAHYEWDFDGDGTIDEEHDGKQQVTHPGFTTTGTKTIVLTGHQTPENTCGPDTETKTVTVLSIPKPRFTIGENAELTTVDNCREDNIFTFTPLSNACVNVDLPVANITEDRNATTSFRWSVSPASGISFQNSDLTQDNNVISFSEPGEYEVRLTVEDNCADGLIGSDASCITVIVEDTPEVSIETEATLCEGSELIANILANGIALDPDDALNIQWDIQPISGSPVPSFDNSLDILTISNIPVGTYEIALTYENNCGVTTTDPVTVEVQVASPATLTANESLVCLGEAFELSVDDNTALSYTWFENNSEITGENEATLSRQLNTPGEYTYFVELEKNGCVILSSTVVVTVSAAPTADPIEADRSSFCPDEDITFTLSLPNIDPPSSTVQWQTCINCDGTDWEDIPGATSTNFSGTEIGSYRAQIDASVGCVTITDPIAVDITPSPTFALSVTDPVACAGEPLELTMTGDAAQYTWSPATNLNIAEGNTVFATLDATTEFTVTAETVAGCTRDTSFIVTVLPAPDVALTASLSDICPAEEVVLEASGGDSHEWLSASDLTIADDLASATVAPAVTTTYQVVGTNADGCRDTAQVTINVRSIPGVNSSDTAVCISSGPFLLALDLPPGVSGSWSGDGLPAGSISPAGEFDPQIAGLSLGGHTVTFEYQTDDVLACAASVTKTIMVNPLPELGFSVPAVVCVNEPVLLDNTSSNDAGVSYRWEVEEAEYTERSPTHRFQRVAAAAEIRLVAEDANGCTNLIQKTVQVVDAPQPAFSKTVDPETLCGPLSVTFTNESVGETLSYTWDFGTGETSNKENPGAVVFPPGVLGDTAYVVSLSVTNACTTLTFSDSIFVRPQPVANFLFEQDTICSGYPLPIHNNSTGLPETFVWEFGLAEPVPLEDRSGTFTQPFIYEGEEDTTYLVTLTATNACGESSITRPLVVTPNQVEAFYNIDTRRGCGPLEVTLTSNQQPGTGNQVMFIWGDGDTTQGPIMDTHIYETPGTYYPKLVVQNGCNIDECGGSATADCGVAVEVFPTPVADFDAPDRICVSDSVVLQNLSSNAINSEWTLGNGQTFTGTQPPPFFYDQTGEYNITLVTYNQPGCRSEVKTHTIVVTPLPIAEFTPSDQPYCEDNPVQIQNNSSGATSYQWVAEGLGIISTEQDLDYAFSAPGIYELKLSAMSSEGCVTETSHTVEVSRQAEPEFTFTRSFGCGADSIVFSNQTTYPPPEDGVYEWDFGNGATYSGFGSIPAQLYPYPAQGTQTYTAILTVSTEGCTQTYEQTIEVSSQAGVALPEGNKPLAFTPTALTNNRFRLNYVQVTDIDLRIFSREGVEVFQTNDPEEAWDGYYREEIAPAGLYNVQVSYRDCAGGSGNNVLQLYLILENF